MNKRKLLLACALVGSLPVSASAAIHVYDDKAAFLAQTGALSATGALPRLGAIAGGVVTLGSVTISLAEGATVLYVGRTSGGTDWTPLLAGNEITLTGKENMDLDLAAPVYSFGFDVAEPSTLAGCGVPCIDSTFSVTLLHSGAVVDAFNYNAPNEVAAFVGVWSDVMFDRVEIRETVGGIESDYFGEVFTGNVSAIPEPHTWAMLLAGLGLIGWSAQRTRCA